MAANTITTREIEEGPEGPQVAAFFDLDRTIIAGFSATAFLAQWILSGRMTAAQIARVLAAAVRFEAGQLGFSAFVTESSESLAGVSEDEYRKMASGLFESWLAADIYPESRALIRAHQQRGHTVGVVSSATRYQVEPIAENLGIEHIMCTELEVVDGCFTGAIGGPTCFREGKATAATGFAAEHGIDMEESYFYTDSRDDLSLLNIVGNPRPLNPDRRLAEIAAKRGWPARRFTSRGRPSATEVARTALTLGSFGASFALGMPAAVLDGDWRRTFNLATSTWGELGSALAGINVRVTGEANLWTERPAVFIFNHQSAIDMLLLCKLLRRDFVGIGKKEIESYPLFGPLMASAGTVFIDRYNPNEAVAGLAPALEALDEGLSLAIAPEGTRSPTPKLGRFKKGAFRLAMDAGVPIVPIVFLNALDALPKNAVVIRSATIDALVLDPIDVSDWKLDTLDDHIDQVRKLYLEALGQSEHDA